jgi:hypothetical protein
MNIRDFLRQRNVPLKEHGEHQHATAGWINVDCPSCSPRSGRYRLGINLSYLYASCWSCGPKKLLDVLVDITGMSRKEMAGNFGQLDRTVSRREEHRGTLKMPKGVGPMLPAHLKYLRRRYFSPDELSRVWGVQGIGKDAALPWRLFIPIHFRGEVVSWTTRSLSDQHERRYWSAAPDQEAIPHKRVLYGVDYVRHTAIVVEGPTDVWRIGPGAVCTFGTSFTQSQLALLSGLVRVVVCFDTEPAAQRQAQRLASTIAPSVSEVFLVTLPAADPGSASEANVARLRRRFLDD